MNISPDNIIYWEWGPVVLNATIVFTWIVMAILVVISWLVTRKLSIEPEISRWQNGLEIIVSVIRDQISDILDDDASPFLPFIGTTFLFVSLSNFLTFVPGYEPPTGSIYTTSAVAIIVFIAVPIFGISRIGLKAYLRHYIQPTFFMLPFRLIGEFSRTLAMSVRLFGNMMSGSMIAAILISTVPLFIPIVMHLFGLLIGQVQAYILAILAAVYIGSVTRTQKNRPENNQEENS